MKLSGLPQVKTLEELSFVNYALGAPKLQGGRDVQPELYC